jgi:D-alanyl-D-alanine carboxypeptidase/D-alanyl-D-alanine-endopeptidase (penicillin-binding protein 4)
VVLVAIVAIAATSISAAPASAQVSGSPAATTGAARTATATATATSAATATTAATATRAAAAPSAAAVPSAAAAGAPSASTTSAAAASEATTTATGKANGSGSATQDAEDEAAPSSAAKPLVPPIEPKARVLWVRERIAAAIAAQPKLGKARITISVLDLATGNELYTREPDIGMSLASTAKILTATAALAVLGGGFRWRTSVYGAEPDDKGAVAGDLYVKGRGDPMLGVAELRALAAEVAARGVRSVDRVVIDGSYFDDAVDPPHFSDQPAETAGFRAPVASFGVARSTITVVVVAEPGGGARVTLDPQPGGSIKLVNKGVVSIPRGRTRLQVAVKPKADVLELTVSGQIKWGEGSWEIRKRVADPARFAGEIFRRALIEQGIKVKARTLGSATVPLTAKVLAVHESATLAEVLRHMNKQSDNYLAECVLKTLGAETRPTPGPATWVDGRTALHGYLEELGMPKAGYRVDNGSGLFDATEVSARQMTTVLAAAHRDYRIGPDLLASLPVGGIDGTLARRWHGHPARGRVRAKTGTLDKVITLAGYLAVNSEHTLGFAILVNDIPPGQRASARTVTDDIIDALAAYLGAS